MQKNKQASSKQIKQLLKTEQQELNITISQDTIIKENNITKKIVPKVVKKLLNKFVREQ